MAEKQDPKTADSKEEAKPSTEGLVKVKKAGETMHVHPTTVDAHKAIGWKVIED